MKAHYFLPFPFDFKSSPLVTGSVDLPLLVKEELVHEKLFLEILADLNVSVDVFCGETLPFFQRLLQDDELFSEKKVPLLVAQERVVFSKKQAAYLLGALFFGFFDAGRQQLKYPAGVHLNIFTLSLLWRREMKARFNASSTT